MKVAVIGSRSFNDYKKLKSVLSEFDISLIVSGGAKGADKLAEKYAKENNIPTSIHLPNYDEFGKFAPLVRNNNIIEEAESVIAFWDGVSLGTKYTIDIAIKADKNLTVIGYAR